MIRCIYDNSLLRETKRFTQHANGTRTGTVMGYTTNDCHKLSSGRWKLEIPSLAMEAGTRGMVVIVMVMVDGIVWPAWEGDPGSVFELA